MLQVEMSASVRNTSGKGPMRQLRMQGLTPAVVYGGGAEAQMLQLDTKSLMADLLKYNRKNVIVTLKVDATAEKSVTIEEIQTEPVNDTLIHVDFCEIDLEKVRSFNVPVIYQGLAKGVDLGGEMAVGHEFLVLRGKPLDMPDELVVDVTGLAIGDDVKCSSIPVPDSVQLMTDGDAVAVAIQKPGVKIEEDEEEETEEAAATE